MDIRVRLFVRYFLSVLIPVAVLIVLGVFSVFFTRRATRLELERLHDGILIQLERSVESFIDELDAAGVAISSASDLLVDLRDALDLRRSEYEGLRTIAIIQSVLNPSVYARPALHSIYVFFDDFPQAVLTSEFDVLPLEEMPDTGWIAAYRAMDPTVESAVQRRLFTPLLATDVASDEVITIYRRIFLLSRPSLSGVVVLNISVDELSDLVEALQTHPGQELTLYGPDDTLLFGTPPMDSDAFQISSRRSVSGWRYTLYTPKSLFLRPADTVFRISASIVAVASLGGIGIALLLTRRHFGHIREVLQVIDSADVDGMLPDIQQHSQKGFGYVTYRVLRTVMEKKYLEIALSERELREKTLELLFLRSQMSPHFLFNTLEVINWKSLDHTGGPTEINEMISRLSEILKYSLRGPSRFVALNSEIDNCRNYLELQKKRYGSRLRDRWHIEPATTDAAVIPMLLQPLIENAIYHGAGENSRATVIDITATMVEAAVCLEICDNGPGMTPDKLIQLRERTGQTNGLFTDHVGLVNTSRRLELAFGSRAALEFGNRDGGGFCVAIRLPYESFAAVPKRRNSDGVRP